MGNHWGFELRDTGHPCRRNQRVRHPGARSCEGMRWTVRCGSFEARARRSHLRMRRLRLPEAEQRFATGMEADHLLILRCSVAWRPSLEGRTTQIRAKFFTASQAGVHRERRSLHRNRTAGGDGFRLSPE